jgi:hypothetical protein
LWHGGKDSHRKGEDKGRSAKKQTVLRTSPFIFSLHLFLLRIGYNFFMSLTPNQFTFDVIQYEGWVQKMDLEDIFKASAFVQLRLLNWLFSYTRPFY